MADLDTITLGETPVVESLGSNDKVLIESGGRMKRVNSSAVGGGGGNGYILDITSYQTVKPG